MNRHRTLTSLLSVAPLFAVAAVAAPAGAATRTVSCHTYSDFPNLEITSARGLTCTSARTVMKAYHGQISHSFSAPQGFACRQVSGVAEGGQWRCTRRAQAFRFEFKD